jgi:hypothetical protein
LFAHGLIEEKSTYGLSPSVEQIRISVHRVQSHRQGSMQISLSLLVVEKTAAQKLMMFES